MHEEPSQVRPICDETDWTQSYSAIRLKCWKFPDVCELPSLLSLYPPCKRNVAVAAEVRKLAERSKVAADEIVDLALNSKEITESAGGLMAELIPEMEKTSQLVQEISAASLEQNSGADQINNAIQQLNQVTQQNAASAEEMATSSEELYSQADQLKEQISFFKVNNSEKSNRKNPVINTRPSIDISQIKSNGNGKSIESGNGKSNGISIDLGDLDSMDKDFENF